MMPERPAAGIVTGGIDNPLLSAATPLLNAIVQIRQAATHDDPAGLRQQLVDEVRHFENRCKLAGLPFDLLIGCRYCLCSAIDEAASRTPWGSRGVWSGNGLLVTFHNETWGGEKFYQLLARISQAATQHLWLLEVIQYCLLLGYEGRYRAMENGRAQRDATLQRLGKLIADTRSQTALTPVQENVELPVASTLWRPLVPLWAAAAVAALIAALFYTTLNWRLGTLTAPLLRAIYQVPLPDANRRPATTTPLLNLRQALSEERHRGVLQVNDGSAASKIIIQADTLFRSGSTLLKPEGRQLLERVATVIAPQPGTLLVSAYSDDRPMNNSRFASSYEYTQAQSRSVAAVLMQQLTGDHYHPVKAEGRGDSNDLLPNDSSENRQRNRRIEIILFAAPTPAVDASREVKHAP
ncbi:hypothetical protein CIG19_01360 [Enterobacterales bacterium CwR94]|nr:hypothetical protein CIG19_01360 [Enterobacterales bacterium CwR94]